MVLIITHPKVDNLAPKSIHKVINLAPNEDVVPPGKIIYPPKTRHVLPLIIYHKGLLDGIEGSPARPELSPDGPPGPRGTF